MTLFLCVSGLLKPGAHERSETSVAKVVAHGPTAAQIQPEAIFSFVFFFFFLFFRCPHVPPPSLTTQRARRPEGGDAVSHGSARSDPVLARSDRSNLN